MGADLIIIGNFHDIDSDKKETFDAQVMCDLRTSACDAFSSAFHDLKTALEDNSDVEVIYLGNKYDDLGDLVTDYIDNFEITRSSPQTPGDSRKVSSLHQLSTITSIF